ncbi:MAG: filamentous hemagglutinin N-terminal domain-containing protein [Parachlamydiales bacterium]|nr:filamentous hemagglutinin N-terminal domain-containing protein [Parachlamydiales bacterium]
MKRILGFIFLINLAFLSANPSGEKVIHGKINIERNKDLLNILQKSKNAIINWQDFSISGNEITKITALLDNSSILNRVISSNPSLIFGKLQSNANVYLVNQNGIIISKNSCIDTRKLVLSTLNIADEEFLNSKDLHFQGESFQKIQNSGQINALEDVFFIAKEVENKGLIKAQDVSLIGSTDVLLVDRKSPKMSVKNKLGSVSNEGRIEAVNTNLIAQGGNIYSLAVNQEGVIDTNCAYIFNGKVVLSADEGVLSVSGTVKSKDILIKADHIHIENTAILDASSELGMGSVVIGIDLENNKKAKTTYIHKGSQIFVDSYKENDAGKVLIWSDEKTVFEGFISAKAYGFFSNGGFVEISSNNVLQKEGSFDLSSQYSKKGSVLFDPGSVFIKHGSNDDFGAEIFTDEYLNDLLKTANVEIATVNSSNNQEQIIFIDSDVNISWEEDTTLSLKASKSIEMKKNSVIQNTSENNFLAIDFEVYKENGNYSGIFIDENAKLFTKGANISLKGNGGNVEDQNYGLHIKGIISSDNDDKISGNINLSGFVGRADEQNFGIFVDNGTIKSKNGNVFLTGNSLGTNEANHGICFDNNSFISLVDSNLEILGSGSGTNAYGVYFAKSKIEAVCDSTIKISAKSPSAAAIYFSSDSSIISEGPITFTGKNSFYSYGEIKSKKDVLIQIGNEGAGRFLLKKPIIARSVEILGSDFDDSFYIDCDQTCNIIGNFGKNTLIAPDTNNIFVITKDNQGILNETVTFKNIQNLKGSIYNNDTFYFEPQGRIDGRIEGGDGVNTLYAPNKDNIWTISNENSGSIKNTLKFQDIQNLFGSEGNDTFKFLDGAEVTGIINGKGGYNIIDCSNATQDIIMDLHKIKNIHEIIGGGGVNSLIGPESKNTWYITGLNNGNINGIKFSYFENLIGSDLSDSFYIIDQGRLDGRVDGSRGVNYLFAPNLDNKWFITGVNRGFIEDILSFVNIHNLVGGEKQDIFKFQDYAFIEGTIDGKSNNFNNTLDFSSYLSNVTVDLNKIENIQNIIGGKNTTLVGKDIDNIWSITDLNAGILNDNIAFTNVENIIGGSKDDIFEVEKTGSVTGFIDGKLGNNKIHAKDQDNLWDIYALDSGKINDKLDFKNISNLQGSEQSNIFVFTNESKITGRIDGGSGKNNILDFSNQKQPVVVDLNYTHNVQKIIGGQGQDTLVGLDENNIWYFTGLNEGVVKGVEFIGFENLTGGKLSDVFVFSDGSGVTGIIDGGNETSMMNILDYSLCKNPVKADILTGNASNTGYAANFQAAVLPNLSTQEMSQQLPSFIEIPLSQVEFKKDFYEEGFHALFASDIKFDNSMEFDFKNFPIHLSLSDEKILVYRAPSAFVITKNTSKKVFAKATMSPFLANTKIGDSSVRMKNNLKSPIITERIASRGDLKQVKAIYEQDLDGYDLDDVTIVTQNIKERSIKQRPRPLHFISKKSKLK